MGIMRYLLVGVVAAGCAWAQPGPCTGSRDLHLTNGKIVTLDKANTVVSEVIIQDGKFTAVGKIGDTRTSPCTRTINLRGRMVVPGLIDNHNHIVLLGMRPGYDIRLETAASIADIQAILKAKAKTVPAGSFITTLGDFNAKQVAEKRLPTLAELDAALPDHPYLLNGGGTVTNSRGKTFFESKGIMVSPVGVIAGQGFLQALNALRAIQTFDDKTRGTMDAMTYLNSFGLTTSVDMGAFTIPGTPDMQEASVADNVESLNPWTMYDAFMALHREGRLTHRLRIFFLTQDTRPDVPILKQRLLNSFLGLGDDMLKTVG